jgi:hypothetical protein
MSKQKVIALCMPSLGLTSMWWTKAVFELQWPLNTVKAALFCQDDEGNKIDVARNSIVKRAMELCSPKVEVTDLLWIDDDVIVQRSALRQLASHNRPIRSGVYFTRDDPCEPLIFPCKGGGTTPFKPDTTFETWGHGMGLTLISLEVYRKMLEAGLPMDKSGKNPEWYRTPTEEDTHLDGIVLQRGGTEDLNFLDRAAQLGFTGFVDCSKHTFGFHVDVDDEKKTIQGYPKEQWKQWQNRQKIQWPQPDGSVVTWD